MSGGKWPPTEEIVNKWCLDSWDNGWRQEVEGGSLCILKPEEYNLFWICLLWVLGFEPRIISTELYPTPAQQHLAELPSCLG